MANSPLLQPNVVCKEALDILTNNLVFVTKVNTSWEGEFEEQINGYKKGQTVNIRKPARFVSTVGSALSTQDFVETNTSLTVATQRHVDVTFTSQELTQNISDFGERILKNQMNQLANDIDFDALSMYNQVHNLVGTPGTTPNSFLSVGNAYARLQQESAPTTGLSCLLEPVAGITMADALKGTFVDRVSAEALETGFITNLVNTKLYMAQGVHQHTVGALGGTPVVNGGSQTGSSLVTNGWSNSVTGLLNKGDVITVAGVYAVNPLTRQTTGVLRNFVVTAAVNSDGSGNATIPVYPAITPSGATQTVTASPAGSAAITVKTGVASTAYPQNLMFAPDAFAFASVPLEMPKGVDFAAQQRWKGITLRIVKQYTISNDSTPCRMDVLYGYNTVFPELAARITG